MSYHIFFDLSTGLSRRLRVPKGTRQRILIHIAETEQTLGLKRTPTYTPEGEPPRAGWHWREPGADMIAHLGERPKWPESRAWEAKQEGMASCVREHNHFVRSLYRLFTEKHTGKTELLQPKDSVEWWGGLASLDLPTDLWTRDHYEEHLRHLGRLLLRGEDEGVRLDCKLKPKQAAAILNLLDCELDRYHGFDVRAALTLNHRLQVTGHVGFSYDGGYDWCEQCGPIDEDYFRARVARCSRAKCGKCPLKNNNPEEFE